MCSKIGETDWAKIGRFTGISERELTNKGLDQVKSTAAMLVGPGKLLDPDRLARIYVSPRKRAVKTFELLLPTPLNVVSEKVRFTEDIAEWGYGRYEGMKNLAIRDERKEKGLDIEREWDIWVDGCEQGEYVVS